MAETVIRVTHHIEYRGEVAAVATKIASDQSTGTFTPLPGETPDVRRCYGAHVEQITPRRASPFRPFPTPVIRGPFNGVMQLLPIRRTQWEPISQR